MSVALFRNKMYHYLKYASTYIHHIQQFGRSKIESSHSKNRNEDTTNEILGETNGFQFFQSLAEIRSKRVLFKRLYFVEKYESTDRTRIYGYIFCNLNAYFRNEVET